MLAGGLDGPTVQMRVTDPPRVTAEGPMMVTPPGPSARRIKRVLIISLYTVHFYFFTIYLPLVYFRVYVYDKIDAFNISVDPIIDI